MGIFHRLFGRRAAADRPAAPARTGEPVFDPDQLAMAHNLAAALNAWKAGTGPRPSAVAWVRVDRRGEVHLDGRPVSPDDLAAGLARVRQARGGVVYFREAAEAGARGAVQASVDAAIRTIMAVGLPIKLAEEDFDGPQPPYMPDVDPASGIAACLAAARRVSAGQVDVPGHPPGRRFVAIVTPDRLTIPVPGHPPEVVTPAMGDDLRRFVPPEPKLNVTVIAFTAAAVWTGVAPTGRQLNTLIPFLGYLMGMASDGHTVVAFEGHPAALRDGCRDADLLVVDGAMVDHLPADWVATATAVMRTPTILVFARDGSVLRPGPPARLVGTLRGEWTLPSA